MFSFAGAMFATFLLTTSLLHRLEVAPRQTAGPDGGERVVALERARHVVGVAVALMAWMVSARTATGTVTPKRSVM